MFAELNNIFDWLPSEPPVGQSIVITASNTDAGFLLHHLTTTFLRGDFNVCFVAFVQTFNHYNNIGNKLGVSLKTATEEGKLVFIEGLKMLGDILSSSRTTPLSPDVADPIMALDCFSEGSLHSLYRNIKSALNNFPSNSPTLVIFDDISALLSLGIPSKEIGGLVHNLKQLICSTPDSFGCLTTLLQHDDKVDDEEGDFFMKNLIHQSDMWIKVESLKSGYSTEVHGTMTVRWRNPSPVAPITTEEKVRVVQYKIQERNIAVFAVGLSSAVL